MEPEEKWYRKEDYEVGNKQFRVKTLMVIHSDSLKTWDEEK